MLLLTVFTGCGSTDNTDDAVTTQPDTTEAVTAEDDADAENTDEETFEPVEISIASLKGPTTMGMVKLMDDSDNGLTEGKYNVSIYGTADEIVPLIVSKDVDIANVPCNLASVLNNREGVDITVLDINTLGVLYVIETSDQINSVEDLKGKTIYSTGKGTTPEYCLNYILESNGIDPETDVTIEYKSEATEVAAMLENATDAIAVLPQPYVTVAMNQNDKIRIALDLTEEWEKIDGTQMVTGVTIVRNEFLEENKAAVDKFLEEYAESVEYVNSETDAAAALVGQYDIVAEAVAKKALPYCNIVCITGEDMKSSIDTYLNVLYNSDPTSVGGQLPDDSFYYINE